MTCHYCLGCVIHDYSAAGRVTVTRTILASAVSCMAICFSYLGAECCEHSHAVVMHLSIMQSMHGVHFRDSNSAVRR